MYVGTTSLEATQPGGNLKLSLGPDRHIAITSSSVLPTHKGKEEDKSTWFVTDKRKFRVRTEERITTISSTYASAIASDGSPNTLSVNSRGQMAVGADSKSNAPAPTLVIISENIPRSTEDDIKVEFVAPEMKDISPLPQLLDDEANDDVFLGAIVDNELAAYRLPSISTSSSSFASQSGADSSLKGRQQKTDSSGGPTAVKYKEGTRVYFNKMSHNIYWAMWVKPGTTLNIPFKYRIIWPDEKSALIY
jgi:hypothetical protein